MEEKHEGTPNPLNPDLEPGTPSAETSEPVDGGAPKSEKKPAQSIKVVDVSEIAEDTDMAKDAGIPEEKADDEGFKPPVELIGEPEAESPKDDESSAEETEKAQENGKALNVILGKDAHYPGQLSMERDYQVAIEKIGKDTLSRLHFVKEDLRTHDIEMMSRLDFEDIEKETCHIVQEIGKATINTETAKKNGLFY